MIITTLILTLIGANLPDPGSALLHKLDDPGTAVAASNMLLHKLDNPAPRPITAAADQPTDPDGWPPRTLSKAMRPATVAKTDACPLTGDVCRCGITAECGQRDCVCNVLGPPVVSGPMKRQATSPTTSTPARRQATPPQMWRMRDRRGRTWQDADPAWLRTWVAGQDAIPDAPVATYRYAAPSYGTSYGAGVSCAGGACSTGAGFRLFGR